MKKIKVGNTYVTTKDFSDERAGVIITAKSTRGYSGKVFYLETWYDIEYNQHGQVIGAPSVEVGNHVWDLDLGTES